MSKSKRKLIDDVNGAWDRILYEIKDHAEMRVREEGDEPSEDNILIKRDSYTDEPVYESAGPWFDDWGIERGVGVLILKQMIMTGDVELRATVSRQIAGYTSHSTRYKDVNVYELS